MTPQQDKTGEFVEFYTQAHQKILMEMGWVNEKGEDKNDPSLIFFWKIRQKYKKLQGLMSELAQEVQTKFANIPELSEVYEDKSQFLLGMKNDLGENITSSRKKHKGMLLRFYGRMAMYEAFFVAIAYSLDELDKVLLSPLPHVIALGHASLKNIRVRFQEFRNIQKIREKLTTEMNMSVLTLEKEK